MDTQDVCDQIQNHPISSVEDNRLLDFLIVIAQRRKFIAWFTLAAAVLTVIFVLLVPNEYTAATLVLPPTQSSSMAGALMGQLSEASSLASLAGASLGIRSPGDLYVSLFRSRTVEDALIGRFDLIKRYRCKRLSDARIAFEDRSTVVLGVKDGLIRITVTDRDPNMAAEIANAYVDEFRKLSADLAITEASQRRLFFQQQLRETNDNLTNAEETLKGTEQSTGVLQVDTQARSLIESAAALRGQIAAKEVEISAMHSYAADGNPQLVLAEQQLSALKTQLSRLSGSDANPGSDIIVPKGNIPEAGMEYLRSLRDVKYYETIANLIAGQFELAKLDEARQGAIIQVADEAVAPDRKSSPHRTIIVVLMTFVGFAIALLWTLIADKWGQLKNDRAVREKVQTLRG